MPNGDLDQLSFDNLAEQLLIAREDAKVMLKQLQAMLAERIADLEKVHHMSITGVMGVQAGQNPNDIRELVLQAGQ